MIGDTRFRGEQINYFLRSFQRDKREIRELFHIGIACKDALYHILSVDAPLAELNYRLLSTFDMIQSAKSQEVLSNKYIQLETHCSIGTKFLPDILYATEHCHSIHLLHQSYLSECAKERIVEPSGIKEFKRHWYLVGYDTEKQGMRIFGLDRIKSLEIINDCQFYRNESHELSVFFKNLFGVVCQETIKPEKIIIRTDALYGKYLKNCPLHESQRITEKTDAHYTVAPTYDFVQELLSMYDRMTVLEPQHLKNEILNIHQSCLTNV